MYLQEILSLFSSLDSLILEGFKDDMYRLYPEEKENPKFKAAIERYNSDPKLKEALKRAIKPQGNIAVSIKKQYPSGIKFINLIDSLIKKEEEKQEYREIKKGNSNVNETDYWIIPCRTFKEAHAAAFKYAGNLPRLSNDEIKRKYNILVPEEATYYETSDSPAKFLKKMKNENRFFMTPSWCVAANQDYFDTYKLKTSEDENPLCYVFISKKYPNVRFCVVLGSTDNEMIVDDISYEDKKIKITTVNKISLREIRDPWQIGGGDTIKTGLEMMKLAFGSKIDKVIKDICHESGTTEIISFSELKDGSKVFYEVHNVPSINCSFDSLISGTRMFMKSGFNTIDCNFPVLKNGMFMFSNCSNLASINTDFPSLEYGTSMFRECVALTEFIGKLPNLTQASYMFLNCDKLKKFECDLPKLTYAPSIFGRCESLETFVGDLPSLCDSSRMFYNSNIKMFKSNLPKLDCGVKMFYQCKNLERFDTPLPNLTNGEDMFSYCGKLEFRTPLPKLINGEYMFYGTQLDTEGIKIITESLRDTRGHRKQPSIHLGIIPENDETRHYIQIAENKGWKVDYQSL